MKDQLKTIRDGLENFTEPYLQKALTALTQLEAMVGESVALIVRGCCEADKADPDHADTICISVQDLTAILEQYAAPVAQQPQADSIPVAAFDRLMALCESQAQRIIELEDKQPQAEAVPTVQIVNCDTCKHSANSCDDYPCNRCGVEFGDGPFNRWAAPQQAEAVPPGYVADKSFRWDGEKQQHIPRLTIEFEPVPANSPCDAQGWKDRDQVAQMFDAAIAQQKGQP